MKKELKHKTTLTVREVLIATRDYLMEKHPDLPDIKKALTCNIEVGRDTAVFKWEATKEKESLDEILGLKDDK